MMSSFDHFKPEALADLYDHDDGVDCAMLNLHRPTTTSSSRASARTTNIAGSDDMMLHDNSQHKGLPEEGRGMTLLPEGFVPGENDVMCGRGRKCFNHIGNVHFRTLVEGYLDRYSSASAKLEKSSILSEIVVYVRKISPHGGFVKKDNDSGRFYEVGDFLAREKTSQAFRDALHDQYKSSNTAKKKRRQAEASSKFRSSNLINNGLMGPLDDDEFDAFDLDNVELEGSDFDTVGLGEDDILGNLGMGLGGGSAAAAARQRKNALASQHSARSVLDFSSLSSSKMRKSGDNLHGRGNQSCPAFGKARTLPQDDGPMQNFVWGSSTTSQSSSAAAAASKLLGRNTGNSNQRGGHGTIQEDKPFVSNPFLEAMNRSASQLQFKGGGSSSQPRHPQSQMAFASILNGTSNKGSMSSNSNPFLQPRTVQSSSSNFGVLHQNTSGSNDMPSAHAINSGRVLLATKVPSSRIAKQHHAVPTPVSSSSHGHGGEHPEEIQLLDADLLEANGEPPSTAVFDNLVEFTNSFAKHDDANEASSNPFEPDPIPERQSSMQYNMQ